MNPAFALIAKSLARQLNQLRWLLLFGALSIAIPSTFAATFVVDTTIDANDDVIGDGLCATSTGACSLRAAIEESNALSGADVISLPVGTYLITLGNGDDDAERGDFDVTDSLTINGASQAFAIVDGNAVDRVFDVHEDASLRMSAVTVRNGDVGNQGGGIRNEGALTLANVTISNNTGKDGGGVSVRKNGATATFTDVEFLNNAGDKGGGLHVKDDTIVRILDSTFRVNVADKDGGGAYFEDGVFDISATEFDANSAEKGGGMYVKDTISYSVSDSTFTAGTVSKEGGGIYFDKSVARIARSVVSDNSAEEGGGLFVKGGGSNIAIENVTISGNTASKEGGGIQKESNGIVSLLNVTVYNNGSPRGGGLHCKDGTLSFVNSIIANSSQGTDCSGDVTSQGNNLASDGSCLLGQPGDLPNTDPLVGSLQSNGGPTPTHALTEFSPARDTGTNAGCPVTDQRGQPRPIDGNADGIPVCDIGAYEAEPLYPDYDVQKSVDAVSDPISGGTNPKAIPGAVMQYTIRLGNAGPGTADQDSLVVTEAVPANTSLVVIDFDAANPGPVAFIDGVPASGLSYGFIGVGDATDDIEFSDDGGSTYTYVPTPGADGSDPIVTHFRIAPKGAAPYTGADPVAEFLFKVVVR